MLKQKSSRRNFISNASAGLAGAFVTGIPLSTSAANNEKLAADNEHSFLTSPYLQAPAMDSMVVMWITNQLCLNWVEYGETEQLGQKAQQSVNGLMNTHSRVNCVKLTKLKPNKKYYYKVFSKQIIDFQPYKMTFGEVISSELFSFTTVDPAATEVSWLVLNDIHDRPGSFKDLLKLNGDNHFDFVFLNGDMFDYQSDEKQIIKNLLNPCNSFSSEKPFLYVRGNHETRGKFSRDLPNYYYNYNKSEYYSFQWGSVFAIALDTGEDKEDTHPVYGGAINFDAYREEQAIWLEKQMQSKAYKKAKFRVVMMHIPHMYSGDWHGTKECNRLFGPLFEKYKIDLFVAGHTHQYGMYEPKKEHNYHIAIGGGPTAGKRTLTKISADNKTLKLRMLRDDGSEIGMFSIPSKR